MSDDSAMEPPACEPANRDGTQGAIGESSMSRTITAALAAASLIALAGCRQTTVSGNETANAAAENTAATASGEGINGTWKADIDSVQFDQKPDEYLLQAGQYSCKSCVPPVTVPA